MPELVSAAITRQYGFSVPVVVRSARELQHVVRDNPFLRGPAAAAEACHVGFLAASPAPDAVAALDPDRSPPDRWLDLACPSGLETLLR